MIIIVDKKYKRSRNHFSTAGTLEETNTDELIKYFLYRLYLLQYSFPEANSPLWRVLAVLRGCIMISGFMKL